MKVKSICLIGYYGAKNLGDDLLLKATIQLLNTINNFNIFIFGHNLLNLQNTYSKPQFTVLSKFNLIDLLKAFYNCQVFIFGGGSLFQDASSLKSLIYYCFLAFSIKLCGKKMVLLAQGIGPLNSSLARILTKWVYQIADKVSLRDIESYNWAEKFNSKSVLSADLAWILENNNTINNTNFNKQIIISLRSDHCSKELINNLVLSIESNFVNYTVNLIAFQNSDLPALKELSLSLNTKNIINKIHFNLNEKQCRQLFNEAEFAYLMRFHAILLSIQANCFCLGLSYDPKVKALCQEAELPFLESLNLDINNIQYLSKNKDLKQFANNKKVFSFNTNKKLLESLFNNSLSKLD